MLPAHAAALSAALSDVPRVPTEPWVAAGQKALLAVDLRPRDALAIPAGPELAFLAAVWGADLRPVVGSGLVAHPDPVVRYEPARGALDQVAATCGWCGAPFLVDGVVPGPRYVVSFDTFAPERDDHQALWLVDRMLARDLLDDLDLSYDPRRREWTAMLDVRGWMPGTKVWARHAGTATAANRAESLTRAILYLGIQRRRREQERAQL